MGTKWSSNFSFLLFSVVFTFSRLSNLWSNYSTHKDYYTVELQASVKEFNNKFHSTEKSIQRLSRGWLELNVIYKHFSLFFSWPAPNRLEGIVSTAHEKPAKEWNHKFVKVAVLYFCSPSINAHGNHFYAPNNIMLYHYDALLTGLPWMVKPKTFVAWYWTVILSGSLQQSASLYLSQLR